jgi:hypothetical protein
MWMELRDRIVRAAECVNNEMVVIPGDKLNIVLMYVVPLMGPILRYTEHKKHSVSSNVWNCISTSPIYFYGWRYIIIHKGVSESFRTESITKYTLTTINTGWETTQMVMAEKLTRMTHKIAIQPPHLVAESCTICSSRYRRPVRKLLDTPSCIIYSFLFIEATAVSNRTQRVIYWVGVRNNHRMHCINRRHAASLFICVCCNLASYSF